MSSSPGTQRASMVPEISVDEAPLDPMVSRALISTEVFTSLVSPGSATLVFAYAGASQIEMGGFEIGAKLMVNLPGRLDPLLPLFSGSVSALELDYAVGSGSRLVVRAVDGAHKLTMNTSPRISREMTSAEMVSMIIAEAEIMEGMVTPTDDVHPVIVKPAIDDWSYIQYLAKRVGYIAYMSGGKFFFTPPTPAEEGPEPYESYEEPMVPNLLVLGKNLVRFTGRVSAAAQAQEVNVTGWSVQEELLADGVGVLETDSALPTLPNAELAQLGGVEQMVVADPSVGSESTAELYAESIADYLAGLAYQMHGTALGDPNMVAGDIARVAMAGIPFDGAYLISEATHTVSPEFGYQVDFSLAGRTGSSLIDLVGPDSAPVPRQMAGVAPGVVTSLADPEMQGRVQVSFMWLDPSHQSDWVPVVQPSVGEESGTVFLPEVGTEVLCAFANGDINHPYVLGGLWSAENKPSSPELMVSDLGEVMQRRIVSHEYSFMIDDNPESMGVRMQDLEGTFQIAINGTEDMITIRAAEGQVMVSGGTITIQAEEELTLTAPSVTISGEEGVNVLGGSIAVVGEEDVTIGGATVSVDAPEISLA
ncbi:MAG: VgrG-related protein [Actinomycetota bacterium]|nr:VgrG-related protein [Actinomycetota bacterium]